VIVLGAAIGFVLSLVVRHQSEHWLEGSSQNPALAAGTAVLLVLVAIVAVSRRPAARE